ncbi:hypothetical protein PHMEG_00036528 [Phytophthora megakarya]|uniref:Reverse transcriptase n=1 Tax=Phytophthora megakarya TaxID=4795 RepID=A0A225UL99_9STRA|nr:hypothetical protein PHMEG_00036528 [Phytophthora megakarya]
MPLEFQDASSHDTLLQKEKELYEWWLAEQPPAVERQEYTTPARILARPTEDSAATRKFMLDHSESDDRGDGASYHNSVKSYDDSEASVAAGLDEETDGKPDTRPTEFSDAGDDEIDPVEDSVDMLKLTYISVMQEIEAEIASGNRSNDDDLYEHIPNEMELADYANELAFLPDLTEPSSTVLDYTPYGVVCDIDVQGHMPIKQRTRPTPLRVLEKLYKLLEGLLRAGLITFSDSSWASPIVIMLKKNGGDIRL